MDKVPIGYVTNGVHKATWMSREIMELLDHHFGHDWGSRVDDPALWEEMLEIDDVRLWHAHLELKTDLMNFVREQARRRFARQWKEAAHVVGAGTLLNPNTLTIGFARRFATYKRADLIFSDIERLRALLVNNSRPVQIIFAGKAHPADTPGKEVLKTVYGYTRDPKLEGRVAFIEDYDLAPGAPSGAGSRPLAQPPPRPDGSERHERDEGGAQRRSAALHPRRVVARGIRWTERVGDSAGRLTRHA